MGEITTAELQQLAREVFGREIDARQAESYRARLPTLARAVRILEAWQERFGEVAPATVYRVAAHKEQADGRR